MTKLIIAMIGLDAVSKYAQPKSAAIKSNQINQPCQLIGTAPLLLAGGKPERNQTFLDFIFIFRLQCSAYAWRSVMCEVGTLLKSYSTV